MIAWMRIDPAAYRVNIEAAKKWIGGQLSPYGYGNTQATSLTLKAINMYNTELGGSSSTQGVLSVVSSLPTLQSNYLCTHSLVLAL
jgi:hypothetical protein